jgi:hypothetical protein
VRGGLTVIQRRVNSKSHLRFPLRWPVPLDASNRARTRSLYGLPRCALLRSHAAHFPSSP